VPSDNSWAGYPRNSCVYGRAHVQRADRDERSLTAYVVDGRGHFYPPLTTERAMLDTQAVYSATC
jgi:hypothetical protein